MSDYEGIISAVGTGSNKAKQLAAQLIPRFFKFFPNLSGRAVDAHFDLVEMDDIAVGLVSSFFFVLFLLGVILNECIFLRSRYN